MKSIEERIKYYMGKWYDTEYSLNKKDFKQGCVIEKRLAWIRLIEKNQLTDFSIKEGFQKYWENWDDYLRAMDIAYVSDVYKHLNPDKLYLICFGDNMLDQGTIREETNLLLHDLPVLIKTAWSGDRRAGIICKWESYRHWKFPDIEDISWKAKKDECVWRGATTGISPEVLDNPLAQADNLAKKFKQWANMPRLNFVRKYHSKHNIGFNLLLGKAALGKYSCWDKLVKPFVSHNEQLKHKYIISLEGNDVASGLKWLLLSNSVVIMPKPSKISWAMEDTLVPYEHYVPLSDNLDNLEEVLQWCRENDSTCKEIAENATQYIKQFINPDREEKIANEIIHRYDQNIKWA